MTARWLATSRRCTCPMRRIPRASCACWCAREGRRSNRATAVRGAIVAVESGRAGLRRENARRSHRGDVLGTEHIRGAAERCGGLAVLLAATGIYALLAWSVSRRTREIGIPIAIGAAPGDVARMVLRQAVQPAMAGVLLGTTAALALHAILRAQIEGAGRFDPIAFALPAAILALVSMAASIAPAVRAVRVDLLRRCGWSEAATIQTDTFVLPLALIVAGPEPDRPAGLDRKRPIAVENDIKAAARLTACPAGDPLHGLLNSKRNVLLGEFCSSSLTN